VALHPAENRGYRELYLTGRQLVRHWEKLQQRLAGTPAEAALRGGADDVREMLLELEPLTARHGLHGKLAAQGGGAGIGSARATVVDRFLERNQAVRLAHGELEHVITLLGYLAEVGRRGRNTRLAEFCGSWEERLIPRAGAVRAAAVELGADPDSAIEPLDPSPVGRAAHTAAQAVGTVGEWVDRQAARRRPDDY
jgi:hypothetical protein